MDFISTDPIPETKTPIPLIASSDHSMQEVSSGGTEREENKDPTPPSMVKLVEMLLSSKNCELRILLKNTLENGRASELHWRLANAKSNTNSQGHEFDDLNLSEASTSSDETDGRETITAHSKNYTDETTDKSNTSKEDSVEAATKRSSCASSETNKPRKTQPDEHRKHTHPGSGSGTRPRGRRGRSTERLQISLKGHSDHSEKSNEKKSGAEIPRRRRVRSNDNLMSKRPEGSNTKNDFRKSGTVRRSRSNEKMFQQGNSKTKASNDTTSKSRSKSRSSTNTHPQRCPGDVTVRRSGGHNGIPLGSSHRTKTLQCSRTKQSNTETGVLADCGRGKPNTSQDLVPIECISIDMNAPLPIFDVMEQSKPLRHSLHRSVSLRGEGYRGSHTTGRRSPGQSSHERDESNAVRFSEHGITEGGCWGGKDRSSFMSQSQRVDSRHRTADLDGLIDHLRASTHQPIAPSKKSEEGEKSVGLKQKVFGRILKLTGHTQKTRETVAEGESDSESDGQSFCDE